MVPVQLRYTNVSSWRVASDAQAGGDDAQLVCEHQLCRWQWYCWVSYSAKHLFLSDMKNKTGRECFDLIDQCKHHVDLMDLMNNGSDRYFAWNFTNLQYSHK